MPNLLPMLPVKVVSAEDLHCHFHLRNPVVLANLPTKVVCAAACAHTSRAATCVHAV